MSYLDRSRPGMPMAADARAHGPGAARAALERLAGWTVTAADGLAGELLAGGAQEVRRAREMRRDLADDPPPEGWADEEPGPGLRLAALGSGGDGLGELFSAFLAAFPQDHPDRRPERSEADEFALLAALVGGRALGPVMDLSGLVVDDDGGRGGTGGVRVGAALVVNDRPDEVPWIGEVFRRPDRRYAGLGGLLLRRALGRAAERGLPEVGLAVTEGNPAVRSYERLGFRTAGVYSTVRLPATAL